MRKQHERMHFHKPLHSKHTLVSAFQEAVLRYTSTILLPASIATAALAAVGWLVVVLVVGLQDWRRRLGHVTLRALLAVPGQRPRAAEREEILDGVSRRVSLLGVAAGRPSRLAGARAADGDGAVGVVDDVVAHAAQDGASDHAGAVRSHDDHHRLLILRDATDHLARLASHRPQHTRQLNKTAAVNTQHRE